MSFDEKDMAERNAPSVQRTASNYLTNWPVFLINLVLAVLVAWAYLHWAIPEYEIRASILIQDEKKGTEEAKAVESIDQLSGKKIIENEVEVIQSNRLIDTVIKRLNLISPVSIIDGQQSKSAYTICPIQVHIIETRKTTDDVPIPFVWDPQRNEVKVQDVYYPLNKVLHTPLGTLSFVRNPAYDGSSRDTLFQFDVMDSVGMAASIKKRLYVAPASKLSSVVNLLYKDAVPKRGEQILNNLISAYNSQIVSDRNNLASNTLSLLDDRLKILNHQIDSIERRSQNFRSTKGAVDLGSQAQLFLDNVNKNDVRLNDINNQLSILGQVDHYVTTPGHQGLPVPSGNVVGDPILTQLVGDLYKAEINYESIKRTTGENNAALVALNDQIEKFRSDIQNHVDAQKSSLITSRQSLVTANESYASSIRNLPAQQRALVGISRELNTKTEVYNLLLSKREETALAFGSQSGNAVIDSARSSEDPVSPKAKIAYLTSVLAAILISLLIISAKAMFKNTVSIKEDIESITSLPVIGEIGANQTNQMIVLTGDRRTFLGEQFRKLRATLRYAGVSKDQKKILITSSIPGEGKSFISANLALSLAQSGKRVALIDADLNHPTLSMMMQGDVKPGLQQILNEKMNWENLLMHSDLDENLYFISAGLQHGARTELTLDARMDELLEQLEGAFDYIVLDTAPTTPISDAMSLSQLCDLTIFVVRHNYTPKYYLRKISQARALNQLKNVAIVYNGISLNRYDALYGDKYIYGHQAKNPRSGKKLLN